MPVPAGGVAMQHPMQVFRKLNWADIIWFVKMLTM